MAEILSRTDKELINLADMQNQFAAMLDVEAELLRHLRLCSTCGAFDYQWTDWTRSYLPDGFAQTSEEAISYRGYLAERLCTDCDGTGFEGGSFGFSIDEWLKLGKET